MGRMRENPRYNVISLRISDEEREELQEFMEKSQKSISDLMREAMDLLKDQMTSQFHQRAA